MGKNVRVVLMTAPQGKKSQSLAKALVQERLAACVNVIPSIVSYYRWKGRLHQDNESLLIAKTTSAKLPALMRWVTKHHPYTVPEILALPVVCGSPTYLRWLSEQV